MVRLYRSCSASWPRSSKKYSARSACSVRRSFSRSAALTWAAYRYSRTVFLTRPHRSGSQDTSHGREKSGMVVRPPAGETVDGETPLVDPPVVPLVPIPALPAAVPDEVLVTAGVTVAVGKKPALASLTCPG